MWRRLEQGEICEVGDIVVAQGEFGTWDMNNTLEQMRAIGRIPHLEPVYGLAGARVLRSESVWRVVSINEPEPIYEPADKERKITHDL